VSEQAFTDRENEIRKLRDNLTGGVNTMVISPVLCGFLALKTITI
jgi:hypothetical protein